MNKGQFQLNKNRIETLTDGIYAIALTLAVLTIDVSELQAGDGTMPSLSVIVPQVINYAIAFFVLASFWSGHHRQTDTIEKVDNTYIRLNISMLFFVALVPFTTDLMGSFNRYPIVVLIYSGNLFIIGVLNILASYHANRSLRPSSKKIPDAEYRYIIAKGLVIPVTCILVITFAYTVSAEYSGIIFLLIPVVHQLLKKAVTASR